MVRRPEKWGGTGAGMGTGSIYRFFWSHIVYCDYMVKTPYLYHNYVGLFIIFFKYNYCLLGLYRYFWPVIGSVFFQYMGMDQYLLIQFLVGWTSIYQLFWCSPGVQGFDTLPYIKNDRLLTDFRSAARWDASRSAKRIWRPSWQIASGILSDAEEIWGGLIVSDTLW